ncbi:class I SAM-dependent methyltransferase [Burkholderia ambifaria]|uniref:class I SAM-dependent methyltransferase n=1 Tax=Burkholderia ambifaria TaxID=152480 RepID=UPI00158B9471|nr:methyltransferase domain-containing protein [Burkholderia ambifaria]MBR8175127.1 methyltransferase domain-containing protein [Burkholderia ambifaria]
MLDLHDVPLIDFAKFPSRSLEGKLISRQHLKRNSEHLMTVSQLKQTMKHFARPLLRPLLFRLNRPLILMEPRLQHLENELRSSSATTDRLKQECSRSQRTIDDLTKVWLRVRNDMSGIDNRLTHLSEIEGRLEAGIQARLDPAIATAVGKRLEAVADSAAQSIDGLRQDMTQRNVQVDDTLRYLLERVEFVRREMMYELSYGAGRNARPGAVSSDVVAKVVAPGKVEEAQAAGNFKVNLGCGHIAMPEYVNVDAREVPGVDVVADVGGLPFDKGSVDEVFSSHLIEHFPQEELRRRLLPHWRSMLKPGGRLRAIVPDGEAMLQGVAAGSYSFDDFREVLFGSQDYNGDFHFNLLTPESLTKLVEEAGFGQVEVPVRGRRNGQCFEFELSAIRLGSADEHQ